MTDLNPVSRREMLAAVFAGLVTGAYADDLSQAVKTPQEREQQDPQSRAGEKTRNTLMGFAFGLVVAIGAIQAKKGLRADMTPSERDKELDWQHQMDERRNDGTRNP